MIVSNNLRTKSALESKCKVTAAKFTNLIMLALLTACLFVSQAIAKTKISAGNVHGRDVKVIENSLVSVAIAPEIGGRILSFKIKHTPSDTIYVARHNINHNPDDMWSGVDYGGITDVGSTGWPGPFWGANYDIEPLSDHKGVMLETTQQGINVQRKVTLPEDSTIMKLDIAHTNTLDKPKTMSIRTHAELAVGTCADNSDYIYLKDKEGLKQYHYRLGWEDPRYSYENPVEGWMAHVDSKEKIALIRLFQPVDEDIKVLFWRGHNEGGPVRDKKGGFYALDRFMNNKPVEPGETINATEEFYIIQGLSRVDFVNGYMAGAVELDKLIYGPGQEVNTTVLVGGAKKDGPYKVTISTDLAIIDSKNLPAHQPGQTSSVKFKFYSQGDTDLKVSVLNTDGKQIANAVRKIKVDKQGYQKMLEMIKVAENLRDSITSTIKQKGYSDKDTGEALKELAEIQMQKLENAQRAGNLEFFGIQAEKEIQKMRNIYEGLIEMTDFNNAAQKNIDKLKSQIGR
jgi:hypothetical protein